MFDLDFILKTTNGRMLQDAHVSLIRGFSIDSRAIQANDCFVALTGTRTHGGAFIPEVYKKGAAAALVDQDWWIKIQTSDPSLAQTIKTFPNIILVADALAALHALADAHRKRISAKTVAITGSAGKTSTKEILRTLLGVCYRVKASISSFNNALGVSLTLLALTPEDEIYIQEIGANHKGEIAALVERARPELGILTNVGPAHLEGFGSLAGVYDAKLELAAYLKAHNSHLVYGGDDAELVRRVRALQVRAVPFGRTEGMRFELGSVRTSASGVHFSLKGEEGPFEICTQATYQLPNVLAAMTAADMLGVSPASCRAALKKIAWPEGRFSVRTLGSGITFVHDAYNANPFAFRATLESFCALPAARRIVVLGDMLELGKESRVHHEALGDHLASAYAVDAVIGVGKESRITTEAAHRIARQKVVRQFSSKEEAAAFLQDFLKRGDVVLFKGSRGIALENLMGVLESCFTCSLNA